MKNNKQFQVTANLIDQLTRTAKQVKTIVVKQVTPQNDTTVNQLNNT